MLPRRPSSFYTELSTGDPSPKLFTFFNATTPSSHRAPQSLHDCSPLPCKHLRFSPPPAFHSTGIPSQFTAHKSLNNYNPTACQGDRIFHLPGFSVAGWQASSRILVRDSLGPCLVPTIKGQILQQIAFKTLRSA